MGVRNAVSLQAVTVLRDGQELISSRRSVAITDRLSAEMAASLTCSPTFSVEEETCSAAACFPG